MGTNVEIVEIPGDSGQLFSIRGRAMTVLNCSKHLWSSHDFSVFVLHSYNCVRTVSYWCVLAFIPYRSDSWLWSRIWVANGYETNVEIVDILHKSYWVLVGVLVIWGSYPLFVGGPRQLYTVQNIRGQVTI